MNIWTSLLITVFPFFNTSVAVWDRHSPLVLVQLPRQSERFPFEVSTSSRYQCTVYHNNSNRNSLTTHVFCPNDDPSIVPLCNYAESFDKSRYDRGERPRTRCTVAVEFDMRKVENRRGEHQSCTHNGQTGYLYRFLYWRCKRENNERKETVIYEACYQDTEKQIILGSYTIETPRLLGNQILQDERDFHFDFNVWPYYAHFQNHFERITIPLFRQNPQYIPRPVLPPEWLPFALQRRPLYHMSNAGPMDASLIRGWKILMVNLRDRLSRMNEPINVTAGLLDVLKDVEGDDKYLGEIEGAEEIAIASVWWVLIYNRNNSRGVVIMMHNEPKPNIPYYVARRCSKTLCGRANIGNSLPDTRQYRNNFIYCCEPRVITNKFGLAGVNNIIKFP